MAPHRHPGPTRHQPTHPPIDDGTLVRANSQPPGPVMGPFAAWLDELQREAAWLQWQEAKLVVGQLFKACLNPKTSISDTAWTAAARQLGVEVELIKAVASVEAPRGPFDDDGRPTILYERHYFHRLTKGHYDKTHPKISNKDAGGYGTFSSQYAKLEEAYLLDPSAALQSASWGKFQIMGKNYHAAGYPTVEQMVESMMQSEENQLTAFVTFVGNDKALKSALLHKQWATFALHYNGDKYKKNQYDAKLKAAYDAEIAKSAAAAKAAKPQPH